MKSVVDTGSTPWDPKDPQGCEVAALGPPLPAHAEGKNWIWEAGNPGMTASDLARWDIGLPLPEHRFPNEGIAIVVLTNGTAGTNEKVTNEIEALLFPPAADPAAPAALMSIQTLFAQLQAGRLARSVMTEALDAYFSEQLVSDFASSLRPLGTTVTVTQTRTDLPTLQL